MRLLFGNAAIARRSFSTSLAAAHKFRRIPSFGNINPIDLSKYQQEPLVEENQAATHEKAAKDLTELSHEGGLFKSFLFGSSQAQLEAAETERSFSERLMRGGYVHELLIHDVLPSKSTEYTELLGTMYPKLNEDRSIPARLIGSWRTVVGDMDQFVHIWEYDGYPAFHTSKVAIHKSIDYLQYLETLRTCLRSRTSQLVHEFDFWGGTPAPRSLGGIFELRTYDLKPGRLAEWEVNWRHGLECRRQVMEPIGAWFSGVGKLNRVYHIWQFLDMQHRKISRRRSWEIEGWAETTHKTVNLIDHMESQIMVPMDFSPLR
ncbi:Protein NipSnap 1 [Wickerhamiella sorbophila]|uniref:Protein NipSnap 1 n=1 Tax=Wickerhamiella sorbophila TaxID=45607 RepID=A0A2T0FKS6_9ASCO|nr:Protein NipSnap 1 [Wickerhamiella sorbophila]PRT55580.1 Protein NipSnap 1 [Wickerhamiella sorbophila]